MAVSAQPATHDLVVVVPGIMGSTLMKEGHEVWAPSAGSVLRAIGSFGASVKDLTLAPDLGDNDPRDGVSAERLMPDLHLVPGLWSANLGYDALLDRLRGVVRKAGVAADERGHPANLLAFPYDWRLSNRFNGRRLKTEVEPALERLRARGGPFADAQVTFICHSMGGLVARWYIEKHEGWKLTRTLIAIGTPHRGALKALDELVNGLRKGFGPLALDLTTFARSLPSAYELLPEYACIATDGGLLKVTETTLPHLDADLVKEGAAFHAELDAAPVGASEKTDLRPIVGIKQATTTTATIDGEQLQTLETIDGQDDRGDATVPRLSATPAGMALDDASIHWVAACHGSLQHTNAVLDQIEGVLTAGRIVYRGAALQPIGLRLPDLALAGEEIQIEAQLDAGAHVPLVVTITNERGRRVEQTRLTTTGARHHARLQRLPPAGYLVTVAGYGSAAARVAPVTSPLVVWKPETV